ncbi:MAG: OmpA family protein [Vicinamibacterales bacterium]
MNLAALVLVWQLADGAPCKQAQALRAQALALPETGVGLEGRLANLNSARRLCPSAEVANDIGDTLEKLGRLEESATAYRSAIDQKPDWALPYFGLGDVYRALGRPDDALYWYENGLRYAPNDPATQAQVRALRADDPNGLLPWRSISATLDGSRSAGVMASVALNERLIPFAVNSASLATAARAQVREIAYALWDQLQTVRSLGVIASTRAVVVEVSGHSDLRGSDAFNIALSQRRADAVVNELVTRFDIPRAQLKAVGLGRSRPLCTLQTEECHARNRRVELRRLRN